MSTVSESISKARDLLTKLRETRDPIERVEVSRSLVKAAGEVKAASLSQRSTQATGRETAQTDQVAPPQQAAGGSDGRHVSLVTGPAIVVKPRAKTEIAKIILPDTAGEKPQQGAVLAVGPGRLLDNGKRVVLDLKEGDRVLFAKYSGTEFKIEDDDLLILSERDILAVIGNDN